MAFQRDKAKPSGGGGGGFQRNKTDSGGFQRNKEASLMDRVLGAMSESGRHTREAVMHPVQSASDLLRTTSDFISFGGTDRLRAALKGTDYEKEKAETEAADTRLGSINDALNVGAMVMQPSVAGRYMPQGAGAITKGLGYGAEGAAQSGLQAAVKGEDILPAMAYGGMGGAGGSIGSDVVGSVANVFSKNKPRFKTDEDLFAAAETTPRNTRQGKDLARRSERLEAARLANTEGQSGFKKIQDSLNTLGRKQSGVSREESEALAKLANTKSSILPEVLSGAGDLVQGGTSWGRLPVAMKTGGVAPIVGTGLKMAGKLAGRKSGKDFETYKKFIRDTGEKMPPNMTPEDIELMRDYLARMGMAGGRNVE